MAPLFTTSLLLAAATVVNAYWLMGINNFITTQRLDPIVNPGKVSGHVHAVLGGSNFGMTINTASLRNSECTSIPIPQDKSNYWFPQLYFQWANGSFTSLTGGAVIYYLFDDKPGVTMEFPDDFRMLSGDPTLRTYDPNSYTQQAVSFLCLDFNGVSTRHEGLPPKACPSGVRAQINFPSCWDGKNTDSSNHKSHVTFPSDGPDKGTCKNPKFPITLPRIFIEVYWASHDFDAHRNEAMDKDQPFVFSYGDRTGYGYHADFINGWQKGVLQKAVDNCHCNIYGDPQCCVDQGIFGFNKDSHCYITDTVNEVVLGTLPQLPGNNPVQEAGKTATMLPDPNTPAILSPVYVYTGNTPPGKGKIVTPAVSGGAASASPPAATSAAASKATSSPAASSLVSFTTTISSPAAVTSSRVASSPSPVTSKAASQSISSLPFVSSASAIDGGHDTFIAITTTSAVSGSTVSCGSSTGGSVVKSSAVPVVSPTPSASSGSGSSNPGSSNSGSSGSSSSSGSSFSGPSNTGSSNSGSPNSESNQNPQKGAADSSSTPASSHSNSDGNSTNISTKGGSGSCKHHKSKSRKQLLKELKVHKPNIYKHAHAHAYYGHGKRSVLNRVYHHDTFASRRRSTQPQVQAL